jgi:hypothetical protein
MEHLRFKSLAQKQKSTQLFIYTIWLIFSKEKELARLFLSCLNYPQHGEYSQKLCSGEVLAQNYPDTLMKYTIIRKRQDAPSKEWEAGLSNVLE